MTCCSTMITTNMEKQKSLEDELYLTGLVLAVIAAVGIPLLYWFLEGRDLSRSGCVFQVLFGMYCPGCGGTRSVDALLHGHVLQSFWYHPLVPYGVTLYLIYMTSWTAAKLHLFGIRSGMKFRVGYLYAVLVIVAINFILKNVLKLCFGIAMI